MKWIQSINFIKQYLNINRNANLQINYRQGKDFELSFNKIFKKNAGEYTCTATNNKGSVESGIIMVTGNYIL